TETPQIRNISNKTSPVWDFMHKERNPSSGITIIVCDNDSKSAKKPYGAEDFQRIEECTNSIVDYIIEDVMSRFEVQKMIVAGELNELNVKIALTTDIWTSHSNQLYL
ncbi:11521_t:CDS:2, partial [Scutellospora calospora]